MAEVSVETVSLPDFCDGCLERLLEAHGDGETWKQAAFAMQRSLFLLALTTPTVVGRCPMKDGARDVSHLTLVLAEIGCLACYQPKGFERRLAVLENEGPEALMPKPVRIEGAD